jgi:type I restriction enzyme S subunit
VDEIAAHQRIIDGARQIVEGWKPNLELELHQTLHDEVYEWGKAKIGDVCAFIDYRGKTPNKSESGVRLITAKNVKMGKFFDEPREYIADYDSWMTRGIPRKGDVLFTTEGPLGNVAIIDIDDEKFAVGQRIITLQSKEGIILPVYLANVLMSKSIQAEIEKLSTGSTVKGILARYFRDIEIPLPPLDIQREIIARIERERVIVEGNQELIRLFEEKIRKVIERVWEG